MPVVRPLLRSSARPRSSRPRLAALRLTAPHRSTRRPLLSRRVFFVQTSFPFYGTADFSCVPRAFPRFDAATFRPTRRATRVFQLLQKPDEPRRRSATSISLPISSISADRFKARIS